MPDTTVRVEYIGAVQNFSEVTITGNQQVWRIGSSASVETGRASQLVASGKFRSLANDPAMLPSTQSKIGVTSSDGGIGNVPAADGYAQIAAFSKATTPRQGPLIAPRSTLSKSLQTIWRRNATNLDIVSRAGGDLWLRTLLNQYFTSSSSVGLNSEFWRFVRLVKLDGAIVVPSMTPSAAGSYTTADRIIHPHTDNGGMTAASGIIHGSTAVNAVISWAWTVPASGIVSVALFNSPSTAQQYEVTCGGVTVTGTLTSSPTNGILPKVVTLYDCTPGAGTVSVKKTNSGSSLYTAGPCYDLSTGVKPPSDGSMIYWFGTDARYIDHPGSNELAFKIGSTFSGSYHGGHYGRHDFVLDGAIVDVTSGGPIYSSETIDVRHEGRIGLMGITAVTALRSDGHTFDAKITADALAITETNLLMVCARPEMSNINGEPIPADSVYHDLSATRQYLDVYSTGRGKALTTWLERIKLNGVDARDKIVTQGVNNGSYSKAYLSTGAVTVNSLEWSAVWNY